LSVIHLDVDLGVMRYSEKQDDDIYFLRLTPVSHSTPPPERRWRLSRRSFWLHIRHHSGCFCRHCSEIPVSHVGLLAHSYLSFLYGFRGSRIGGIDDRGTAQGNCSRSSNQGTLSLPALSCYECYSQTSVRDSAISPQNRFMDFHRWTAKVPRTPPIRFESPHA
jgi:hypothetical protein